MPQFFACLYLGGNVELTDEREGHILLRHSDLGGSYLILIRDSLQAPDSVHRSTGSSDALVFSRWYDQLRTGKYFRVVVVRDSEPPRDWIVTTHLSDSLPRG